MDSSVNITKVPIKNIYFMLAYAWDHPHEKNVIDVYGEDEKDIINLLSKVLILKVKSLVKRGLYKEYKPLKEESGIIRGKLLFKESFESFSYKKGKMHIEHEEFTLDILHNQLIKETMLQLCMYKELEREYYEDLKRLLMYFRSISRIELRPNYFEQIKLHRNNQHYRFILNICQLVSENVLLHEGSGRLIFNDFSRDHMKMAKLFEAFVKSFYRHEYPESRARSESLDWGAIGEKIEHVPQMRTDISMDVFEQKYIIDTKFYEHGLAENRSKEIVRSGHLYQLYAYLENDKRKRNGDTAVGILLYPRVYQSFQLHYEIQGFHIKICSVDLAKNWKSIEAELKEILE
ncbi:restriction endonuclease [Allobacillus sp. SKP2-8]|uniref:5-methylcytosine restriction system specificity protein McrC n=1 Tax=unclassified Allobacillus TaxID=2628859 RepID=UPI0011823A6E|nr:restriction endonuclease [Allobacillus sp. SKP2-8]TSJ66128.1 restriction endonuclease [Allobacillus sp. SKP2-8]